MKPDPYCILSLGLGCCSATTRGGGHVTTYHRELAAEFHRLEEGGWVLDNRPALACANPSRVVARAPLCDPSLADEEVDAFNPADVPAHMLGPGGLQDAFLGVLAAAVTGVGNLDHVSPAAYAGYWRQAGSRVGRRRGDAILWEDGQAEPIREAA